MIKKHKIDLLFMTEEYVARKAKKLRKDSVIMKGTHAKYIRNSDNWSIIKDRLGSIFR